MSSEREVSRMFIRYMQRVLQNERINIYKAHLNDIKELPLEDWLLEEIAEPDHLEEFILNDDEIVHLESFIADKRLSKAVASLSVADKMVLYQYYFSELNDVEIASRIGKSSQGVNKRRGRAIQRIKDAYKDM